MRELLKARLSPFRHRDFRNFFLCQTLSMIGTWSHDLARSWIIVEMTGSSGALGNLNMTIALPCLFLIMQGGVFVDRTDIRKLIQWTKSLMGIACCILAVVTEFGHLQMWMFLLFGFTEGLITSFDSPAFQSLTVRLVPREDFQQAIALNSTNFHMSRMLGPIVATWFMIFHGPSLVFLFDGVTYFLIAIILIGVNLQNLPKQKITGAHREQLKDGLKYVFTHPKIRARLLQLMLTLCCVYPMMVAIFRVYVQKKFNLDAKGFGEVFSFPAMGSMAGALSFAVVKPRDPTRALYVGVPLVFVMLLALPNLPTLSMTVAAMTLTGFGLYLSFASLTVSMHLAVQEEFRGRMSSFIGMGFAAIGPLMSFPWGHISDAFGAVGTIRVAALMFGAGSLAIYFRSGSEVRRL